MNTDGSGIHLTAWMNDEGTQVSLRTATGVKVMSVEAFQRLKALMPYATTILITPSGYKGPKSPGTVTIRFQDAA